MANRKYLIINTDGSLGETSSVSASTGASNAGDIPALDSTGKLDLSMMPTGIGADTQSMITSEALSAGDFVNIYSNGGVKTCRKALGVDNTKPAHGFVLSAFSASANALVYVRGLNTMVALGSFTAASIGLTVFTSTTVAGGVQSTVPVATGNIVQNLGTIEGVGSTVTVNFSADTKFIVRA